MGFENYENMFLDTEIGPSNVENKFSKKWFILLYFKIDSGIIIFDQNYYTRHLIKNEIKNEIVMVNIRPEES